jgi:hypothetical protein
MGICVHCMQEKPITANKCPHCHERTGLIESAFWTVFHRVMTVVLTFLALFFIYQCAEATNAAQLNVQQPTEIQEHK